MASVLVVEDEAFTALALVDELGDLGHTVRDAMDGEEAISVLETFSPDILVTDFMMPRMGGDALIRHVRARGGPAIPVVLISGLPESRLPAGMGYDAYLGKPLDQGALAQAIDRLVAQFRA
jgi:CheY-like chemotaxis protein